MMLGVQKKYVGAVVVTLLAGTSGVGLAADHPEVGPNIQVNDPQQVFPNGFPTRSTISLGVSGDGEKLLVGFEDFSGLCGPPLNFACPPESPSGLSGFGFSVDGGHSWTDGGSIGPIGNAKTAGHPSIDVMTREDDHGGHDRHQDHNRETFFYASRLMDATTGTPLGVSVHRGHFAAGTFVWDDSHVLNPPSATAGFTRQSIATAKDDSESAYVVETDSTGICNTPLAGFGRIEVWRTHNGGDTWQGPAVVSPETAESQDPNDPLCGTAGFLQVAAALAVGPRGEVYVVWQYGAHLDSDGVFSDFATIAFSRSLDGGRTFDAPRSLVDIISNRANQPVAYAKSRMNDQARIAVATSGKYRGRVYVAYYEPVAPVSTPVTFQSLVSVRSLLVYSDDQGRTWSTPRQLGPPVPPTRVKRFWPTVSLRPNGDVEVAYLESQEVQLNPDPNVVACDIRTGVGRRIGPNASLIDTYMIRSSDGGRTFGPPVRISSETSNWCNINYNVGTSLLSNLGDYFGTWSGGDRTYVSWPDARNGFADVFFAEVRDHGHGH
jgi:hypothetical protein